jgi:hypothetical protein
MTDVLRRLPFTSTSPAALSARAIPPGPPFGHDHVAGFRVALAETAVRDPMKQARRTWSPDRRAWQLRYDRLIAPGPHDRIVDNGYPPTGIQCWMPGFRRENRRADAQPASSWKCSHPRLDAGILCHMPVPQSSYSY